MKIKKKLFKLAQNIIEKRELEKLIDIYGKEEKIIFLSTPIHGNLGDHAITIAIEKILRDKYFNKTILEIPFEKYNRHRDFIEKLITTKDKIFLVGGGNFGNLYLHEEEQRRDIVKRYPNNQIIIMPQSLSFTDDEKGKRELEISKDIYSNHKYLNICTRDEKSYAFGKENFKNNNILFGPDSVLYLEDHYLEKMPKKREGVILTLRSDREKVLSNKKVDEIKNILIKKNITYTLTDTIVDYEVIRDTRDYEVEKVLRQIAGAKLNITDRFHGVIFSVITRTPVIVFKSLDHKIKEGIKWFKHLDWVHYVEENENVEEIIEKYLKVSREESISKDKISLKNKLVEMLSKI